MKLGVFQGTFNPIHNAHLRVGKYVTDKYNFDKFLFIPAKYPPHKDITPDLARHRLNVVKLAAEDFPKFEVSGIEYRREGKSYTYLTICELYKEYKIDGKINFVIGTDAFSHIDSWFEFNKLKDMVNFIVFIREDNFNPKSYDYLKDKGLNFKFEPLDFKNISSSDLRERIKNGKSISGLVPKKVKDYIEENGLYKMQYVRDIDMAGK